MSKDELIDLLRIDGVALNEGESAAINIGKYPRIVFWEVEWQDLVASGEVYDTLTSYQVSFFSNQPRDPKLFVLRDRLRAAGIFPRIMHEYVEEKKAFHSFMVVDTYENGGSI